MATATMVRPSSKDEYRSETFANGSYVNKRGNHSRSWKSDEKTKGFEVYDGEVLTDEKRQELIASDVVHREAEGPTPGLDPVPVAVPDAKHDRFGHSLYFRGKRNSCSFINEALTREPQTSAEIAAKATEIAKRFGQPEKTVFHVERHLGWYMDPKKRELHLGRYLQKTADGKWFVTI